MNSAEKTLNQLIEFWELYNISDCYTDEVLIDEIEMLLKESEPVISIDDTLQKYYNSNVLTSKERKELFNYYILCYSDTYLED